MRSACVHCLAWKMHNFFWMKVCIQSSFTIFHSTHILPLSSWLWDWPRDGQPVLFEGHSLKIGKQLKLSSDIRQHAVFFTVREAVKLPLMWKLWSHEDVNKLQRQHGALKRFPARCTWTITLLLYAAVHLGKQWSVCFKRRLAVCKCSHWNLRAGGEQLSVQCHCLLWGNFLLIWHFVSQTKIENWQERLLRDSLHVWEG